jgi:hypothetical protein
LATELLETVVGELVAVGVEIRPVSELDAEEVVAPRGLIGDVRPAARVTA